MLKEAKATFLIKGTSTTGPCNLSSKNKKLQLFDHSNTQFSQFPSNIFSYYWENTYTHKRTHTIDLSLQVLHVKR